MPTLIERAAAITARASDLRKEAKDLSEKPTLSAEESAQLDGLLAEADKADAEAESLRARAERLRANDAALASYGQPGARRTAAGAGEDPLVAKPAFLADPKRGYATHRAFLLDVMRASRTGRLSPQLKSLVPPEPFAAAGSDEQGTYNEAYGGVMTPGAFVPNLQALMPEDDPTVGRTTLIPMASRVVTLPARVDKNHTTSVSGGLRVYRRAETQDVASSRMKLEGIKLEAEDLMGAAFATERLLRESPISFVTLLEEGFRSEFAARRLKEILGGVGVGEFVGVKNAACTVSVAKEASQTAATINGANLRKMRARAYRYSQCVWLANHDTLQDLMAAHIAGTNGDVFLYAPGNGADKPETLMGRPLFFTEFCETIGTVGDILLADFSQYLEGVYEPIEGASSIHVRFLEHEQAFRFTMANAGAPWWSAALTPAKSATTLSPFVTLATRA